LLYDVLISLVKIARGQCVCFDWMVCLLSAACLWVGLCFCYKPQY